MLGALKFNSAKCETACRLCLGRIKLLKNKRNMQMKQYRKDIAELLKAGKQDYARIRVEAVIREALTLTAYEILELYLELLAVRSSLVANSKEIPRDMIEALSSVLYASTRVPDLPELQTLHKMFAAKYGKEYVQEACSDVSCRRWMVNENLQRCLTIEPPEPALKLETLSEIAQEYGVEWDMDRARRELLPDNDPLGAGASIPPPLPTATSSDSTHNIHNASHHMSGLVYTSSAGIPGSAAAAPAASGPPSAAAAANSADHRYTDVAAAVAAATAAAQQARSAAEAAARLAAAAVQPPPAGRGDGPAGGGRGGGGGGGVSVPAVTGAIGVPSSRPVPPQGWLSGMDDKFAAETVAAAAAGSTVQMHPLPGSAPQQQQQQPGRAGSVVSDASAESAVAGGYRVPSSEEIQRAYDAAQGPPPKVVVVPPPSAAAPAAAPPPAGQGDQAEATAATAAAKTAGEVEAPDNSSSGADLAALPGVPHGSGVSAASSEYDELQKRFEALKKS